MRLQARHEHIVSQMKKELRKDGEKCAKKLDVRKQYQEFF